MRRLPPPPALPPDAERLSPAEERRLLLGQLARLDQWYQMQRLQTRRPVGTRAWVVCLALSGLTLLVFISTTHGDVRLVAGLVLAFLLGLVWVCRPPRPDGLPNAVPALHGDGRLVESPPNQLPPGDAANEDDALLDLEAEYNYRRAMVLHRLTQLRRQR